MLQDVRDRVRKAGGYWNAIVNTAPKLANAARVERNSTSSCISRSDTGETMPGSEGQHIYLLVKDGADGERFLRMLHARLWLAGLGWYVVGKSGQLLERSLVDMMVFAAERLVFEGPPRLDAPLVQDLNARRPQAFDGDPVDTAAACPDLSAVENSDLDQAREAARYRLKPAAEKARTVYVGERAEDIVKRTGLSTDAARRVVEKTFNGKLLPAVTLVFDDVELGECSVADVLKDPAKFVGQTLADPREGVDYGRGKARIMQRADGSLWVHSFAHGRSVYDLCHDKASIEATIRATAENNKDDVAVVLERLIRQSNLEPDEEQAVLAVACLIGGLGRRPLAARIKNAKKEQRRQQYQERTEQKNVAKRRAGRQRVELAVPHQGGEWLPAMEALDEALCRVPGPMPPVRNIEHWPCEIRWRSPFSLHELTSAGSNCEEAETSRLPPPAQPLITKHNRNSLSHEIERYIEYYEETEELGRLVVALPSSFVDHFIDYRDSQMPQVASVVTAPMILPNGDLFAPEGLDKRSRLYFAIEPTLRTLVPNDVSREATADALDFLCNAWLCDVATSFEGKCGLIAAALTIIERVLLSERPAFFVSAGRRGGGKTTAITMLVLAVTGSKPPAAAWSKNEEERRKSFLSYLSQGLPVIVWDNLGNGEIVACKYFDALLTSETYSDRVLGATEQRVVPATTVHLFSGNNVGPKGDTASRSFKVRLEVTRSDPENRDFEHSDPMAWTLDHRGRILQAMYTVLLGNPQLQPGQAKERKTRFKMWWHLVGSAVENAAAALKEIQSPQTPESQKACLVDFGAMAAAVQSENEDDIATAQILDIFYRRWMTATFMANDVAKLILSPPPGWEDDAATLRAYFDPSGRRGSEIPAGSIGMRLGKLVDGPVPCDELELTLKSKSAGTRKPAWFHIEAKSSAT
jgi:transposase